MVVRYPPRKVGAEVMLCCGAKKIGFRDQRLGSSSGSVPFRGCGFEQVIAIG